MNLFPVVQDLYYIVGDFIKWMFDTPLIPGLFSVGTVVFGATVISLCIRMAEVMMRKPVENADAPKREWRKNG